MESRRKEVLLLILAVVALGVGLYTFRAKPAAPAPGPAPHAEKAAPGGEEKAGEPAADAKEGQKPAAEGEEGKAAAGAAAAQRNPFSAPGGPAPAAEQPASGGEGVKPAQPEQAVPVQEPAQIASGGAGMVLTGIVDGKQSMAILRQDDRRFYVRVGDSVGDGYRVQSIGRQQVVLAGQQGKVILKMGGRQ